MYGHQACSQRFRIREHRRWGAPWGGVWAGSLLCRGAGGHQVRPSVLAPGPSLSCFHWPRGVQACARLQQLLEWMRSAGHGEAGERFFRKLSCTLNLLATPRAQLIQVGGRPTDQVRVTALASGVNPTRACIGLLSHSCACLQAGGPAPSDPTRPGGLHV